MKRQKINEFIHTRLFKVLCGVVILLLILALYNCVVNEDKSSSDMTPEQQEALEMEKAELKDTFDVVGDYLFPAQKHSADELMTEAEREAKANGAEKKTDEKLTETQVKTVAPTPSADDIVESVDLRSDTHAAPVAPASPEPSVEKLESPKVAPIEQ